MSEVVKLLMDLTDRITTIEKNVLIGQKELLTVSEAALVMGVQDDCIYKLTSAPAGKAPAIGFSQPGGKLKYIEKDELLAYMRKNKRKGADELLKEIEQEKR